VSVMSELGISTRKIASKIGCSLCTVVNIIQKKNDTGTVVEKAWSGHPRHASDGHFGAYH